MASAVVLTYHAVERGPAPLCVSPELFREHLDCIVAARARVVTIRELGRALRERGLDSLHVAITFDDGFASVVENALPLLVERELAATVFCVAGHLGGDGDWPSAHDGGFRSRIATAAELSQLVHAGIEIGSHGNEHTPLVTGSEPFLERELIESKQALEQLLQTDVTSFAYPYGAGPTIAAKQLVAETYDAACTTRLGTVSAHADPLAIPRVDAHFVRDTKTLTSALAGTLRPYLAVRGVASRARRVVLKDYASVNGR